MCYSFDTSAYLPCRGHAADYYRNQWQRYTLRMTEEQHKAMTQRRERLQEDALRSGRHAAARAYDRAVVRRYAV